MAYKPTSSGNKRGLKLVPHELPHMHLGNRGDKIARHRRILNSLNLNNKQDILNYFKAQDCVRVVELRGHYLPPAHKTTKQEITPHINTIDQSNKVANGFLFKMGDSSIKGADEEISFKHNEAETMGTTSSNSSSSQDN